MKKISAILLAIMLLAILPACGGSASTAQNPAIDRLEDLAQQHADSPIRGSWYGNVFTSEYLGFKFTLPDSWETFAGSEIAEFPGADMDSLDGDIDLAERMELAGLRYFFDMVAVSPSSNGQVLILFENIPSTIQISVYEYMEIVAEITRQMGAEVTMFSSAITRIGAYDWYSYESTIVDILGISSYMNHFHILKDDFAITISIGYDAESESLEEILAMFSPL